MAHKKNITLSVPLEMYDQMKKHPEIKWSQAAREGIAEQLMEVGGIVNGKVLLSMLPEETRKGIEEISKLSKESWREYYKGMKESEKRRLKLLTQASSSKKITAKGIA